MSIFSQKILSKYLLNQGQLDKPWPISFNNHVLDLFLFSNLSNKTSCFLAKILTLQVCGIRTIFSRPYAKSKTPFNVIWQPDNVVAGKNLPYVHDTRGDTGVPYVHDTRGDTGLPYVHDNRGDTGLPYIHDTKGDTGLPYVLDTRGDTGLPYVHDSSGTKSNQEKLTVFCCQVTLVSRTKRMPMDGDVIGQESLRSRKLLPT